MNKISAEIVGIMLGDGCLYKEKQRDRFQTRISSAKEELSYQKKIKVIFEEYFQKRFHIYKEKTHVSLRNSSKGVGRKLQSLGIMKGSKLKNKVAVPSWIFEDDEFTKAFLRGIFDTDGSVFRKYGHYAQIQIKFAGLNLTKSTHKAFEKLGFKPTNIKSDNHARNGKNAWRFYLSRQNQIDRFFKEVRPRNQKHINRFNKIRKSGDAGI